MNCASPTGKASRLITVRNVAASPLDRGELDKIIERSNAFVAEGRHDDDDDDDYYRRHPGERQDYDRYGHKKRKKSFLGEIFDFD